MKCDKIFELINGKIEVYYEIPSGFDNEIIELYAEAKECIKLLNNANKKEYKLCFVLDETVNALSVKYEGEYYIGIYLGALIKFRNYCNSYFKNPNIYCKVEFLNSDNAKIYSECLIKHMIWVLITHEFIHIKNGHCDIKIHKKIALMENNNRKNTNDNLFEQSLERDADCCTMATLVTLIIDSNVPINKYDFDKRFLKLFLCSLANFTVFYIFNDEEEIYDIKKYNFLQFDHPHPAIRMAYTMETLNTVIEICKQQSKINDYEMKNYKYLYDWVLVCNNMYSKEELFNNRFISLHSTKQGAEHCKKLDEYWVNVFPVLEKYCDSLAPKNYKVGTYHYFEDDEWKIL